MQFMIFRKFILIFRYSFGILVNREDEYMSIEQELKELILSKYGSVREFSKVLDMPYSTIDSIFKRGVENASVANIIRICEKLSISADGLAEGKIVLRASGDLTDEELELLKLYRQMNAEGRGLLLGNARTFAGNPAMLKETSDAKAI